MAKVTPISASTQRHLPVADVVEDIVLTKDGGAAVVLRTTALNFSLLSENEQESVTLAYAALLNSLSFPIQIIVRSQKKDISKYLSFLDEQERAQTNPKLRGVMASYKDFVSQIVKKRNVLEKEFFIIIPFSPIELGMTTTGFVNLFSPRKIKRLPFAREYVIKKAKTVLYPRRDHLIRQAGRLGIRMDQLTTEQLATLLFKIYNPEPESNPKEQENNEGAAPPLVSQERNL